MPVVERVSSDDALARVRRALDDRLAQSRINFGQVDVTVEPRHLVDVMTTLRDAPDLRCVFFTFLSAIDWSAFGGEEDEEGSGRPSDLEVFIHVYAPERALHVNVHVPVDPEESVCPSITGVYAGAQWHERETFEMFGIHFDGHPNLVKLYLPEDFEGNPLRKSFRLPSRAIKPWPGAKDPEEAAAGGRG